MRQPAALGAWLEPGRLATHDTVRLARRTVLCLQQRRQVVHLVAAQVVEPASSASVDCGCKRDAGCDVDGRVCIVAELEEQADQRIDLTEQEGRTKVLLPGRIDRIYRGLSVRTSLPQARVTMASQLTTSVVG